MRVGDVVVKEIHTVHIYTVADELNVARTTVQSVLDEFVSVVRGLIKEGYEIKFEDLASIKPVISDKKCLPTMGYICKQISDNIGVPYFTSYSIVCSYLNAVREEILNGRSVDIRKLVSFHVIFTEGDQYKVNCCLSSTVRKDLQELPVPNKARVSFNSGLRHALKEGFD